MKLFWCKYLVLKNVDTRTRITWSDSEANLVVLSRPCPQSLWG